MSNQNTNVVIPPGLKVIKLMNVAIDTGKAAQSNKYYNLYELGDGNFLAEWGRVEKTRDTKIYPMSLWEKTIKKKTTRSEDAYTDVTHLYENKSVVTSSNSSTMVNISNRLVQQLMDDLQRYANRSVKANYTVTSDKVTEAMVLSAQSIVDDILKSLKMGSKGVDINKRLLQLYMVIPRQMANVKDHLFDDIANKASLEKAKQRIMEEQATLDVMSGQVALNKAQQQNSLIDDKKSLTILEVMGLQIEEVNSREIKMLQEMMGKNVHQFRKAFKIVSNKTQTRFDKYVDRAKNKKKQLFWHGSRNENFIGILETGLVLRPTNAVITGKMFGAGTYFAEKCQKSINYTSLRGSYWANGNDSKAYLAVLDVHVGSQFKIKHHESWCYDLNETNLRRKGDYDSLHAVGGADLVNDEFIVYNESQCTIQYLVEIGG